MVVPTFTRQRSRLWVGVGAVVVGVLLLWATVAYTYNATLVLCAPDYWTLAGIRLPVIRYSGMKLLTDVPRVYWYNGCNTYVTSLYPFFGAVLSFAIGWWLLRSRPASRPSHA